MCYLNDIVCALNIILVNLMDQIHVLFWSKHIFENTNFPALPEATQLCYHVTGVFNPLNIVLNMFLSLKNSMYKKFCPNRSRNDCESAI